MVLYAGVFLFIIFVLLVNEQGKGSVTSVGIAQRARHPDELKKDNENWIIDIDYYLAQQVCFPILQR